MFNPFEAYIITKLDNICFVGFIGSVISCIGFALLSMLLQTMRDEPYFKYAKHWMIALGCSAAVSILTLTFVPNSKELITIKVLSVIDDQEAMAKVDEDFKTICFEWISDKLPKDDTTK